MFCNPDLIWRSDFDRPRLGQGAFKEAFQAVYKVRRFAMEKVGKGPHWHVGMYWLGIPIYAIWQTHCCDIRICGAGYTG